VRPHPLWWEQSVAMHASNNPATKFVRGARMSLFRAVTVVVLLLTKLFQTQCMCLTGAPVTVERCTDYITTDLAIVHRMYWRKVIHHQHLSRTTIQWPNVKGTTASTRTVASRVDHGPQVRKPGGMGHRHVTYISIHAACCISTSRRHHRPHALHCTAQDGTARTQHSPHSTAQHSTAQRSTAQHSTHKRGMCCTAQQCPAPRRPARPLHRTTQRRAVPHHTALPCSCQLRRRHGNGAAPHCPANAQTLSIGQDVAAAGPQKGALVSISLTPMSSCP
jgi:hypothetical protein